MGGPYVCWSSPEQPPPTRLGSFVERQDLDLAEFDGVAFGLKGDVAAGQAEVAVLDQFAGVGVRLIIWGLV